MLFDYALVLPFHISFRILSHHIVLNRTLNGSNSKGIQDTIKCTLKRFFVNLYISNNDNNAIAVGKVFNALMKVINGIEVNVNKFKMAP